MDATNVAAYLDRIGYAGDLAPTLDTLRPLHRAHLHAVPFENLDIHLGRRIVLDPAALFRKIVGERRGGFCYELNGLFAELLAALGYDVTLLDARVAREGGGFGAPFDHLTLLVRVGGGRWLCDVGFGQSFHTPLSLDAPVEEEDEGLRYRAVEVGGAWRVESRAEGGPSTPEYAFSHDPHPLADFEGMCHHHQTSPASHFTQNLICSLPIGHGRVTLRGRTLIETEGDVRKETPLTEEARVEVLERRFGIRLGATLPP